jgi:VanZ family protein
MNTVNAPIHFEPRFAFLTTAWLGVIYWLSSIPDLDPAPQDRLVLLAFNLSHVPAFAVVAFCWLKSLSKARDVSRAAPWVAFGGAAACAVLDEWHQSFVPGRHASAGDLLLDLMGISVMLLILRRRTQRESRPPYPLSVS